MPMKSATSSITCRARPLKRRSANRRGSSRPTSMCARSPRNAIAAMHHAGKVVARGNVQAELAARRQSHHSRKIAIKDRPASQPARDKARRAGCAPVCRAVAFVKFPTPNAILGRKPHRRIVRHVDFGLLRLTIAAAAGRFWPRSSSRYGGDKSKEYAAVPRRLADQRQAIAWRGAMTQPLVMVGERQVWKGLPYLAQDQLQRRPVRGQVETAELDDAGAAQPIRHRRRRRNLPLATMVGLPRLDRRSVQHT